MYGLSPQQALSLYGSTNPVQTEAAYRTSNYSAFVGGALVRLLDWKEPSGEAKMAHNAFRAFILDERFSCVGAKAAVQSAGYRFGFYPGFPTSFGADGLARDLAAFVAELPFIATRYKTFVAIFDAPVYDEGQFEQLLWKQIDALYMVDRRYYGWAERAAKDPASPGFALSIASHPFFVVGMHAGASRLSRRFAFPAMIFNSHEQFDELKASGHFSKIQRLVRQREVDLQGSINPNLAEYGAITEARQYSGRPTGDDWACPFRPR